MKQQTDFDKALQEIEEIVFRCLPVPPWPGSMDLEIMPAKTTDDAAAQVFTGILRHMLLARGKDENGTTL